jgi:hypothetical protein
MGDILDALLGRLNNNLETQNRMMMHYLGMQIKEASKTPPIARPIVFNLVSSQVPPQAMQILGRNPNRHEVAVVNYGPGSIIFREQWFDPQSMLQNFSDPNFPNVITPGPNQAIPIGYAPQGANFSMKATNGLWAYSVGGSALITMIDEVFVTVAETNPVPQREQLKMSGLHKSEQPGGGILEGVLGN